MNAVEIKAKRLKVLDAAHILHDLADPLLRGGIRMKPSDFDHINDFVDWLEIQLELQARKGEDDEIRSG